jgi:hypothetical protein
MKSCLIDSKGFAILVRPAVLLPRQTRAVGPSPTALSRNYGNCHEISAWNELSNWLTDSCPISTCGQRDARTRSTADQTKISFEVQVLTN